MIFIEQEILQYWAERLQEVPEAFLKEESLPYMDEDWMGHMLSCSRVCQMAHSYTGESSVCAVAAHLFYKIVKNHYLVDGNKRSAVVCTYLFLVLNLHKLTVSESALLTFAKGMASSGEPESVCIATAKGWLETHTTEIELENNR